MKKQILTTIALGTATVAAGMATSVNADQVTVTKQNIGDETKVTTTTTKTEASQQKIDQDKQAAANQQKVVTQNKDEMNKAQDTVNNDKKAVSNAQNKVNNAKDELTKAQAVKDQVTPTNIDQNKNFELNQNLVYAHTNDDNLNKVDAKTHKLWKRVINQ